MATNTITLEAQPRTLIGRKTRQLRRAGSIPVTVYGKRQAAQNLQVDERNFEKALHLSGFSQIVKVDVQGGATHNVFIREIHRHPVSHRLLHADLYAIDLTEKQRVRVPVHAIGKPATLTAELMMLQALDTVHVEALPMDIPPHIDVDVTNLSLEHPVTVAHLPQIAGVVYLDHSDDAVFTMLVTRGGEAEEAAAAATTTAAEPEVVAKRKAAEEE